MVIRELELSCFRNYQQQQIQFSPGVNWISGRNGQGKTNLVEAVHYLCNLESFRTRKLTQLILSNSSLAALSAQIESREVLRHCRIAITSKGRQVFLDRQPLQRVSEYVLAFMALIFTPEDVNLFRSLPGERRRFFNRILSFLDPVHLEALQQYAQALAQKNALLKQHQPADLSIWNELLARYGTVLTHKRRAFVEVLNPLLSDAFRSMSNRPETLLLEYLPSFSEDENQAQKQLEEGLPRERHYGHALLGPHRDDFRLSLDGKPDREFFSQGEFRLTNLSLKIAINAVLSERYGYQPALILDDLFSELDPLICQGVLAHLGQLNNQVFITSTSHPSSQSFPIQTFRIEHGFLQS